MSGLSRAFSERPRVVVLWTILAVSLALGAYVLVQPFSDSGDDGRPSPEAIEQAEEVLAKEQARRGDLAAELEARDREIEALREQVDSLTSEAAGSPGGGGGGGDAAPSKDKPGEPNAAKSSEEGETATGSADDSTSGSSDSKDPPAP